jgi:carbohydrate-selective porin OprB
MHSKQQTTRRIRTICVSYLHRVICTVFFLLLIAVCATAQNTPADPDGASSPSPTSQSFWHDQNHLLGNWGGERTRLATSGVKFDFYVSDFLGNPARGETTHLLIVKGNHEQ